VNFCHSLHIQKAYKKCSITSVLYNSTRSCNRLLFQRGRTLRLWLRLLRWYLGWVLKLRLEFHHTAVRAEIPDRCITHCKVVLGRYKLPALVTCHCLQCSQSCMPCITPYIVNKLLLIVNSLSLIPAFSHKIRIKNLSKKRIVALDPFGWALHLHVIGIRCSKFIYMT